MNEEFHMLPKDRVSLGFIKTFTPELITTLRRGYSLSNLRADALAGLTVAIVGVPLAMALAVASGAKPEAGLFSAIVGGFVISALGGSRFQIGGPASAFVVLVAKTIEIHGFQGLLAATIMAGLILLLLGYMRFGTYIKYIPHSVPVGFTAGIAVILFASQMKELLGLRIAHEPAAFLPKLEASWAALDTMRLWAILMAAASLAFILYQRKQRPRFPGMMTTIAAAGFLTWAFNLPVDTIGTRFGEISSVLPSPSWPNVTLTTLFELVPTAIAIAILGAMESLLSAVVADSMTSRHHNSNCELVAQGYANIASALVGRLAHAHGDQCPHRRMGACRWDILIVLSTWSHVDRRAARFSHSTRDARCRPDDSRLGHGRSQSNRLDLQTRPKRILGAQCDIPLDRVPRRYRGDRRGCLVRLAAVYASHGRVRRSANERELYG